MEEKFGTKARQHVEMLRVNISRYQVEPQKATDTEKAMDDLLLSSRKRESKRAEEKFSIVLSTIHSGYI